MKKLFATIGVIFLLLLGIYFWLMSQGDASNADSTVVTKSLPLETGL